jgi:hypothetical protein
VDLTAAEALSVRMTSLLLGVGARPSDVSGVVTWFGAMQGQDNASVMWSLGARLPEFTAADVRAALERREAVRTWPMRGTVHLVPSRDARWMVELTGARSLAGAAARRARLGIGADVADRAVDALAGALAGGGRLTRSRCLEVLAAAGIESRAQFGYHLLWYASVRGVTCIAPNIGTEQSFALLDEWAPDPHRPERDEALATLAVRFFRSHGPATRSDLVRWTGLTVTDAKRGIAAAGEELAAVRVEGHEMLVDPTVLDSASAGGGMLALPGFDEYMLGYKDRSMMVDPEHMPAIVPGGNGVFQPTIVRDGRVIGTWKRTAGRGRVVVTVRPLVTIDAADRERIEGALQPYARFLDQTLVVRWP